MFQTRGRGLFREQKLTPLVGDWVEFDYTNDKEGVLLKLYPRINELVRPPMCNVDFAVIVMSSVEPNFSQNLLDRYIVTLEQHNIKPIIYISKCDLSCDNNVIDVMTYYKSIGYVVLLSHERDVLDTLKRHLYQKVSVLMGQTGSGKSTLLNKLLPQLNLKTGEISNYLNRGKHTTRHVEIHNVEGCFIADTPGFSSLDFFDIKAEDLTQLFVDIDKISHTCRFRGCQHINEPDCAVKDYAQNNEQFHQRYVNYLQFHQELTNKRPTYYKNKKGK